MDLKVRFFNFKYNAIFVSVVYMFIYLADMILQNNIFTSHLFSKFIGTICGYLVNDIIIKQYSYSYYFYFQNIFKYISILTFQNIIAKTLILDYTILSYHNILKMNFIIFIYFLLDVILDVNIENKNKNKEMYVDILKTLLGFYIVEKLFKNELDANDYIYMIIILIAYYILYTKMNNNIKELLKV